MVSLLLAAALVQGAPTLNLECSYTGPDPSVLEQMGPRRLGLAIQTRGTEVTSVAVEDPTGIFTSGNVVGFVSAGRNGARYGQVPREENPRWRGRAEPHSLDLTGVRRSIDLRADAGAAGTWSGRLHYEIGGGAMAIIKDGPLTCRPAAAAAEGNTQ